MVLAVAGRRLVLFLDFAEVLLSGEPDPRAVAGRRSLRRDVLPLLELVVEASFIVWRRESSCNRHGGGVGGLQ